MFKKEKESKIFAPVGSSIIVGGWESNPRSVYSTVCWHVTQRQPWLTTPALPWLLFLLKQPRRAQLRSLQKGPSRGGAFPGPAPRARVLIRAPEANPDISPLDDGLLHAGPDRTAKFGPPPLPSPTYGPRHALTTPLARVSPPHSLTAPPIKAASAAPILPPTHRRPHPLPPTPPRSFLHPQSTTVA